MSADSPAPPAPESEMFPILTSAQIERLRPLGRERSFAADEILFEAGGTNRPLMVLLDGEIEILSDRDAVVTIHRTGNFSGDVDLIAGHPAVVRARGRSAGRTLEIPAERVRSLVQTDPELSQIFLRAFILRRALLMTRNLGSIVLIGSRHSAGTLTLQEFLTRNNQPYAYLDADHDPGVQGTLERFGMGVDDIPVLICSGKTVLKKPTIEEVADCLGLSHLSRDIVRDLVVIGAGPAGLAAAVYGASEGLDVLVVESTAPGGQAGSSSRIENYLGFPTGVSGQDLASAALLQAQKFGAELVVARTAVSLECGGRPYRIRLGGDVSVAARAVVIATGVRYRKPAIPNLVRFEGVGVYYGATPLEALLCRGEDVAVVGGANSAGQAAVFLSEAPRNVTMLVRGPGLSSTMSRYLIRRIEETPNIALKTNTRIVALEGANSLESVTWCDGDGKNSTAPIRHVFMMTGANPNTTWLEHSVALDEKGFVKTGPELEPSDLAASRWALRRSPLLFETNRPGIFAVGDVRAGSIKRVAAAVGEGSVSIQLVHKVLAE
ncbi:MAG TPA: FAD-dependent oxidoreductase [Thermoanaerobaculia bacterium]|nr:FAD-dependent oxidoreductase [Thermoanaerobaculia bacterium]